jgi:hypothetical protein
VTNRARDVPAIVGIAINALGEFNRVQISGA